MANQTFEVCRVSAIFLLLETAGAHRPTQALPSMSMNLNRILLLLLLILFIAVAELLNLPAHQVNFYFGTIFLIVQFFAVYRFNKAMKNCKLTFQLSSNEWLGGLAVTAYLIYSFSSADMNTWNILAIVLVLSAGGFYANLNKRKYYIVTDSEVIELNRNKHITISDITAVEADDSSISIHTNEYRNHICITPKQLSFPTFPKLRTELNTVLKKGG